MNTYFSLKIPNDFKLQFHSQCINPINPTVTNFRPQSQSRDTQINVYNVHNIGLITWTSTCVSPDQF